MSGELEVSELRARILELEGKVNFLYKHLNVEYVKEMSESDQKVADALRKGNILEAIRLYREFNHVDLANAKLAVEEMKSRL
jgi:hypothetical protein